MDDTTSFSRNPERVNAMLRTHNNQLSNVVVSNDQFDTNNNRHLLENKRPSNQGIIDEFSKYYGSDFGNREPNGNIQPNGVFSGGGFFRDVWGGIKDVAKTVAPLLPLVV